MSRSVDAGLCDRLGMAVVGIVEEVWEVFPSGFAPSGVDTPSEVSKHFDFASQDLRLILDLSGRRHPSWDSRPGAP